MATTGMESEQTRLLLPEQQMRALGYRIIDRIVDHQLGLASQPVVKVSSRAQLDRQLGGELPEHGTAANEVLDQVLNVVLNSMLHTDHPRFFSYVPSPSNFVSAMADSLASGFNVFAGHWLAGSGPAMIEATTIGWLRELIGMPKTAGGIFLSGGSLANLSAIHVARACVIDRQREGHRRDLVVYATDQTHACLAKGLAILGFDPNQLRMIATDKDHALDCSALARATACDLRNGLRPFAVVATAGTTSTGSIDPLTELRALCNAHDMWLHIDGAYGAAAILDPAAKQRLRGIEHADSLALDPHKWWFQPYEMGCLLVRQGQHLRTAFSLEAGYLRESQASASQAYPSSDPMAGEVNFYDLGPQLTRGFRALKLWMSIKTFGIDRFRRAVTNGIAMACLAQQHLENEPTFWEVVTSAQLGIVTFRPYRRLDAPHNVDEAIRHAVRRCIDDGFTLITTTELADRPVFRICTINPDTSETDLRASIDRLKRFVEERLA